MKGRPKNTRKISFIPSVSGFKPYGGNAKGTKRESVFLLYEEYESVRLNDYEKHTQCESAALMGVSRPTFTRIYMSAREKIALAFIEGRRIIIEGGKVQLNNEWYVCHHCHAIFTAQGEVAEHCALCGSSDIACCDLPDLDGTMENESSPALRDSVPDASGRIAEGLKLATAGRGKRHCCGRGRCAELHPHPSTPESPSTGKAPTDTTPTE